MKGCPFLQSNGLDFHATMNALSQIKHQVEAIKSALESGQLQCQCKQEIMGMVKETLNKEIPQSIDAAISKHAEQLGLLFGSTVEEVTSQKISNNTISRSLPNDAESPVVNTLQLRFLGTLPDSFYTLNNILTTEDAPLLVELVDMSGSRFQMDPESFVKIKIVVLDGDFDPESEENSFSQSVVKPRKNKVDLLRGECEILLKEGVATVSDLVFTDNSKSMRNGSFKLGAEVVKVCLPGVVIKEAVSRAFKVKEGRLQRNGKENKPSLKDKVSCLKHIGPTISERLASMEVITVRHFLQLYNTNKKALEKMFPVAKLSEIIKNAKSCSLTEERYRYHDHTNGIVVVLDCIFNIVSVAFDGQNFQPFEPLNDSLKELIYKIRRDVYEKRSELQPDTIPNNQIPMQVGPSYSFNPYINMYPAGSTSETGQPDMVQNTNYYAPGPSFMPTPALPGQLTFGNPEQHYDHQNTGLFNHMLHNSCEFNIHSTYNAQSDFTIPESIEQGELWATLIRDRCRKVRWRKVLSVAMMIGMKRSLKHGCRAEKRLKCCW